MTATLQGLRNHAVLGAALGRGPVLNGLTQRGHSDGGVFLFAAHLIAAIHLARLIPFRERSIRPLAL